MCLGARMENWPPPCSGLQRLLVSIAEAGTSTWVRKPHGRHGQDSPGTTFKALWHGHGGEALRTAEVFCRPAFPPTLATRARALLAVQGQTLHNLPWGFWWPLLPLGPLSLTADSGLE